MRPTSSDRARSEPQDERQERSIAGSVGRRCLAGDRRLVQRSIELGARGGPASGATSHGLVATVVRDTSVDGRADPADPDRRRRCRAMRCGLRLRGRSRGARVLRAVLRLSDGDEPSRVGSRAAAMRCDDVPGAGLHAHALRAVRDHRARGLHRWRVSAAPAGAPVRERRRLRAQPSRGLLRERELSALRDAPPDAGGGRGALRPRALHASAASRLRGPRARTCADARSVRSGRVRRALRGPTTGPYKPVAVRT